MWRHAARHPPVVRPSGRSVPERFRGPISTRREPAATAIHGDCPESRQVRVGIGCSEKDFWDHGPFYERMADSVPLPGIEATPDQVGKTLAVLTAAGAGRWGEGRVR